jgi:hypothetical protein
MINFGFNRIISFLYFGSRAFEINVVNNSDYDFFLILDKYLKSDILKIRDILMDKQFCDLDINLNIGYFNDIQYRGINNFQIRSLFKDFYVYLQDAKVLIGNNIFRENPLQITEDQISKITSFKIQEFNGRCDKLFTQKLTDHELISRLQHNTKAMFRYLLLNFGAVKIRDINKLNYTQLFCIAIRNKILTEDLKPLCKILLDDNFSICKLKKIEKVRRIIYERYLRSCKIIRQNRFLKN